jgi:hypothetical protein
MASRNLRVSAAPDRGKLDVAAPAVAFVQCAVQLTGSRRTRPPVWLVVVCLVACGSCGRRSDLPDRLGDQEFWGLIARLSEPAGTFTLSDNLVSNEPHLAENVRRLWGSGGVYVGVGPEQNFTYIARLRSEMAFIVDIRTENRNLHLLYKALFEISTNRVDFLSRLFSRLPPPDLEPSASVEELFERIERQPPSLGQLAMTATLVRERLLARSLQLSQTDFDGINRVLEAFHDDGPAIQFWRSRADVDAARPTYRQLMTATDATGQRRSFLASGDSFRFIKDLQFRNLIVPVVGDFGGPTAVRRVGEYARERGARIQAFYGSNVGVYLSNEQTHEFCRNLGTLPIAPRAAFIESNGVRTVAARLDACALPTR